LYHRITPGRQTEEELTTYDQWRGAIADGCGLSLAEVQDEELRSLYDRMWAGHLEFMAARS
jgi:hypothetical protein